MKDIIIILAAIGCIGYACYLEYFKYEDLKEENVSLVLEVDSLNEDRKTLENQIKSLKKENSKLIYDLENKKPEIKYIEKEVVVEREVEKPQEPVKVETPKVDDYQEKYRLYTELKNNILFDIKRGEEARARVVADKPKFSEHRVDINGKRSGIRTSESDRRRAEVEYNNRLKAIDDKLSSLKKELLNIEESWKRYLESR